MIALNIKYVNGVIEMKRDKLTAEFFENAICKTKTLKQKNIGVMFLSLI